MIENVADIINSKKMTDSSSDHSSACNSHGFAHQYTPSSRLYPRKYSFVSPDGSLKHQFRNRHHHLHAYGKSPRLSPSLPLNERDNIHKSKDTHRSSRHHGHRQNHRNSKITNKIQNEFEIVLKSKKKEHPSGNGRATPAEEKRHDWHSSDDEEEDIPPFLLGGDGLDFDGFPLNTSTLETNKSYSLHVNDSRKGENTHSFSPSFVKGKRTTTGNAKRLQIVHEETDSVTETMTHKVKKKRKHVLPLRMRIWAHTEKSVKSGKNPAKDRHKLEKLPSFSTDDTLTKVDHFAYVPRKNRTFVHVKWKKVFRKMVRLVKRLK